MFYLPLYGNIDNMSKPWTLLSKVLKRKLLIFHSLFESSVFGLPPIVEPILLSTI